MVPTAALIVQRARGLEAAGVAFVVWVAGDGPTEKRERRILGSASVAGEEHETRGGGLQLFFAGQIAAQQGVHAVLLKLRNGCAHAPACSAATKKLRTIRP